MVLQVQAANSANANVQIRQNAEMNDLLQLQKHDATKSPRDPASAQPQSIMDTTAAQTSMEVEAMSRLVVVGESGAASHARQQQSSGGEGGNSGMQIGVRRAVADENVQFAGKAGGMSK